jgi:hypothetical protein
MIVQATESTTSQTRENRTILLVEHEIRIHLLQEAPPKDIHAKIKIRYTYFSPLVEVTSVVVVGVCRNSNLQVLERRAALEQVGDGQSCIVSAAWIGEPS